MLSFENVLFENVILKMQFSANPVCWCKHCCKKLFYFHTAPGMPLDHVSMLIFFFFSFFVVSENVLVLSKLIYSDLLMDSRRK